MPPYADAISLWQPWATFMVQVPPGLIWPLKTIETRSWYRESFAGRLLIHAAKYKGPKVGDIFEDERIRHWLEAMGYQPDGSDLPRGSLVGEVSIVEYQPTDHLVREIDDDEEMLGNYAPGRWGWMTAVGKTRRYPEPIPYRGAQGIFKVDEGELSP